MKLYLCIFKCVFLLFSFLAQHSIYAAGVAAYSEATDVFEFIDNLSAWHPLSNRAYRQAWERKYPLSLQDKSMLEEYSELRKKFSKGTSLENSVSSDIFSQSSIANDFFSDAFYSSKSVGEALKKLSKSGVSANELSLLKKLFSTNKKKISSFVAESSQFDVKLLALNKNWKTSGLAKVSKKLRPFILGKKGKRFKLLLRPVWWPSSMPPKVEVRGPYLILRYHPLAHTNKWNMDAIAEAMVKSLLQSQSVNQRENLTKVFRARCRGRAPELRESLNVLFTKMLMSSYKNKKNFDLYQRWVKRSFTDLLSKLLFPLLSRELKGKAGFSGRFMTEAANLCRALNRLAVIP